MSASSADFDFGHIVLCKSSLNHFMYYMEAAEGIDRFPMINSLILSVGAFIQNGPNILSDPDLHKRWPSGLTGFLWRLMTVFLGKPPVIAGEPIADLVLSSRDRRAIKGSLFRPDKRIGKPDNAMKDKALGLRLWNELIQPTGLETECDT